MRLVGQVPGIVDDQTHWTCRGRWPRALRSSRTLAEAPHPSAPLHPAGAFPRATGSIPGLLGPAWTSRQRRQLRWGSITAGGQGVWGRVLALTLTPKGPWAFSAFPYTRFFLCPFFLNFLLWKNISVYQSREDSRMNHDVPINCYTLRFVSPNPPKVFQTKSQASFHLKYIKVYL